MKMIFKKATTKYTFEYYTDKFKTISFCYCILEENKVYQIVEMSSPIKNYKYEILMDGSYNTRHFLMTEEMFNECFRFPRKSHWKIKLFANENECNDFLKGLETDCLKDVKFTENQIMITYLMKGDEDKLD